MFEKEINIQFVGNGAIIRSFNNPLVVEKLDENEEMFVNDLLEKLAGLLGFKIVVEEITRF